MFLKSILKVLSVKWVLRRFLVEYDGGGNNDNINDLVHTQTPKWWKWKKMYPANIDVSLNIVSCIKRASKMLKEYTEHSTIDHSEWDLDKELMEF